MKHALNIQEIAQLPRFISVEAFADYVKENNSFPDDMLIGNALYTMENYDLSGLEICYTSFDANQKLKCITSNRYGKKKIKT